jgi:polyvinyl alcohol dehydrogenase (cytochrome)
MRTFLYSRLRMTIRGGVGLLLIVASSFTGPATAAPTTSGSQVESLHSAGDWPTWQFDLTGSRHNPSETAITPSSVGSLQLKWVRSFPGTTAASSQPAVVDGTVYLGSRDGKFYALEAATGQTRWTFDTGAVVGPIPNPLRNGPAVSGGLVYFGDNEANLYALDAATGAQRWTRKLDAHPAAKITNSPLVFQGKVYVGVSSDESGSAALDLYQCCTFRGSVVALDASTGAEIWRHYTIPPPQPTGSKPEFAPSGAAVWGSPTIDPTTGTLYYGTSNPYSGEPQGANAIGALDVHTGTLRWVRQLTPSDTWNVRCLIPPPGGNCPEPGNDFDIGTHVNIFTINGRRVVGAGQKSGVYHVLDAATGAIVWQSQLSTPVPNPLTPGLESLQGIQWGASYDGQRLYVATNQANPGTLFALNPQTGTKLWHTPNPPLGCLTGGALLEAALCKLAMPNAVSSTPGLVYEGSMDGKLRIFSASTGQILRQLDTAVAFPHTVNGVPGKGGSLNGHGAVIANGMLFTNSGYLQDPVTAGMSGNVLLAYGLP